MKRFAFASLLALAAPALALAQGDNPALPGFDLAGSDPKAVQIADEVMKALGGRKAWDETRYYVAVLDSVPDSLFRSPAAVELRPLFR